MKIRRASDADAGEVSRIYLESRETFLPYAPLAHDDDDVRHWIGHTLIPGGRVFVAEDQQELVGMMATSVDDHGAGWIDHLYLAPGTTRRGIGGELLARALAELPRPVRLHTFQQNTGARRFYERRGFRPVAFGDGSDNEEGCPDVLYERRT